MSRIDLKVEHADLLNSLLHVPCLERFADFDKLAHVDCITPYANSISYSPRDQTIIDAGAEVLVEQWKIGQRFLIAKAEGNVPIPDQFDLKQPAGVGGTEWAMFKSHLFPIRIVDDPEAPWNLFNVFLKPTLSATLDEWAIGRVRSMTFHLYRTMEILTWL